MKAKFMQILTMVRLKPGYKKMTEREVTEWKEIITAHNVIRKYSRKQSRHERRQTSIEQERKLEETAQENAAAELNFWLKGAVNGDLQRPQSSIPGYDGEDFVFDLKKSVRKMRKRAVRLEKNVDRALSMSKHGFERIELHLEAQYKVFQDIVNKSERLQRKAAKNRAHVNLTNGSGDGTIQTVDATDHILTKSSKPESVRTAVI